MAKIWMMLILVLAVISPLCSTWEIPKEALLDELYGSTMWEASDGASLDDTQEWSCEAEVVDDKSVKGFVGVHFHIMADALRENVFPGDSIKFIGKNSRTGKEGTIVIWKGRYGVATKGEIYGRFLNYKNGDWKVGDKILIKDKSLCPASCKAEVVDDKSVKGFVGVHFHIMADALQENVILGDSIKFIGKNSRTGKEGTIVIWKGRYGVATKGEIYGRFLNYKNGDWKVGDKILIKDKSLCPDATG